MRDRTIWEKGVTGPQTINGHTYKNLTRYTRRCVSCGEPFSIFVTAKIAAGHADSNSFGLTTCEKHRRNKTSTSELDTLRTANATMKDELAGLYERVRDLEARLAKYELPSALRQEQTAATTSGSLPNQLPWV